MRNKLNISEGNLMQNSSDRVLATASSEYSSSYLAYRAFDSSSTYYWQSKSNVNEWISYQYKTPVCVGGYSVKNKNIANSPNDWDLQASNDGVDWDTLDSQRSIVWDTSGESKIYNFKDKSIHPLHLKYKQYRLFIYNTSGGVSVQIELINFFTINTLKTNMFELNSSKYVSMVGDRYKNITPTMSANTFDNSALGDGVYTARVSSYRNAINIYGLFADYTLTGNSSFQPSLSNTTNQWASMEFPRKTRVDSYSIGKSLSTTYRAEYYPSNWIIQASDDGNIWVDLDKRSKSEVDNWETLGKWYRFKIDKSKVGEYKMYRIFLIDSTSTTYLILDSLKFEVLEKSYCKVFDNMITEDDIRNHGTLDEYDYIYNDVIDSKTLMGKTFKDLGSGRVFNKSINKNELYVKNIYIE